MSDLRSAAPFRPGAVPQFRAPKRTRLELVCEALESRQLLSTTQTSTPDLSRITAQPSLQVLSQVASRPTGLTPSQIQNAYGINQITFSGGNGAGQTIAIIDAYNDPNIKSDLATFDSTFSLPSPSFTVDNLGGNATDSGWALETSLDVEWPTPWLPTPISFWSKLLRTAFPPCSMQSVSPAIYLASA